jgi:hypothetical protein
MHETAQTRKPQLVRLDVASLWLISLRYENTKEPLLFKNYPAPTPI